jgi:hypothetical protein
LRIVPPHVVEVISQAVISETHERQPQIAQ